MEITVKTSRIVKDGKISECDLSRFIHNTITESDETRLTGTIWLLVHNHHNVQIGLRQNGKFLSGGKEAELNPDYLKELRVFSENGELYIWKQQGELYYRLRIDNGKKGEPVNVYPETHLMWGNKVDEHDPQRIYEENRGMTFHFPLPIDDQERLPLQYEVYNYYRFDYDEKTQEGTGLIQFYDARLVGFFDNNDILLPDTNKEV